MPVGVNLGLSAKVWRTWGHSGPNQDDPGIELECDRNLPNGNPRHCVILSLRNGCN